MSSLTSSSGASWGICGTTDLLIHVGSVCCLWRDLAREVSMAGSGQVGKMDFKRAVSVLGLPKRFTQSDVKKLYMRLARKLHPDKNTSDEQDARVRKEDMLKQYTAAYNMLKDREIKVVTISDSEEEEEEEEEEEAAEAANPLECTLCYVTCKSQSALTVHMRSHSGEKPFECNDCGKAFSKKENLKQHKKMHSGQRDYQCNACDKRFFSLKDLQTHERSHTGEKPFKCDKCAKCFTTISNRWKHQKGCN